MAAASVFAAVVGYRLAASARSGNRNQQQAAAAARTSAAQYRSTIANALRAGPLDATHLQALRVGAYSSGDSSGAPAQGIGVLGANQTTGRVTVTFEVAVAYRSSMARADESGCLRVDVRGTRAHATATLARIGCEQLLPQLDTHTTLQLPG
jgi:hypothetical protein